MKRQVIILISFLGLISLILVACALNSLVPQSSSATEIPPPLYSSPTAATLPSAVGTMLTYVPGSTAKLEQLLGEQDKQLHQPTLSQTFTRYGIQGTDLGSSFENNGLIYFLFGDTVGRLDNALDTIATTTATDPQQGVRLDFLTVGKNYLTIQPPGISMGAFEVPVGGITIAGQMYVAVRTNHSADWSTDRSVLTRFTLPDTFQPLRTISQSPAGHFLTLSIHAQPGALSGLPAGGPFILVWGTGTYRKSDAYLSIVPAANFASGQGTLYFSGLNNTGMPVWSPDESSAQPIVRNGTLGDLSVTWSKDLNLWLMTCDSRSPAPAGIEFSYSSSPWGPWSDPQIIFNAARDGAFGKFIHDPAIKPIDGQAGPVIGAGQSNPEAVMGGTYAPYMIEPWIKLRGSELDLYYTLSTWNPYVVMLMKSSLQVH
jgi:Domain of unknown function (DUF4185)